MAEPVSRSKSYHYKMGQMFGIFNAENELRLSSGHILQRAVAFGVLDRAGSKDEFLNGYREGIYEYKELCQFPLLRAKSAMTSDQMLSSYRFTESAEKYCHEMRTNAESWLQLLERRYKSRVMTEKR